MFELFWGILNIVLLIGLIVFLIRVLKLIRKEFGIISALFLTFILIHSFTPSNENKAESEFKLSTVHQEIHENTKRKRILLSDDYLNKTYIHLRFSEDNKLLNASLSRTGLIISSSVTPKILISDHLSQNHVKYYIIYQKNWYLLGLKVYTENFDHEKEILL